MVYVFIAEGFEELEALTPVDVLRRAGVAVTTVGVGSEYVTGAHQISVKCDMSDKDFSYDSDLDAVILPGGMPGTTNLSESQIVRNAVVNAFNDGKLVAAICAAPSVLGRCGVLEGKKATCYPGFENKLKGAEFISLPTVCDGNVITAWGAGAAFDFSLDILEYLTGDSDAGRKMEEAMKCVR